LPPQEQDLTNSRRTVRAVQLANLRQDVKTARQRIDQLKADLAAWQAEYAPLLTSEAGRRIAASPRHLELAEAQFRKKRPTGDQLALWESNFEKLSSVVAEMEANPDASTSTGVTPEHTTLLKQLTQDVSQAATSLADQRRVLDHALKATTSTAAGADPLEKVMQQRLDDAKLADEQRALAAEKQAKAKAAEEHAARMAKLASDQAAAEHRVRELQEQAKVDGLQEETKRREEAIRQARLDREFQRVRFTLDTQLCAFTRPGFAHRQDGTKGPVSLSLIRSKGALQPTRPGMEKLMALASVGNDRPRGPIPQFIGGDNGWRLTRTEPIELAQQLLTKYGDLMVQKGMLAP
jgi:hypothetical protein